jgi:TPR repeat protein
MDIATIAERDLAEYCSVKTENQSSFLAEKDAREAWQCAAEAGSGDACFLLARCFQLGAGVDPSTDEAAHWFREGAELGHSMCQSHYGQLLIAGPTDRAEGCKWLILAAESGSWSACFYLSV